MSFLPGQASALECSQSKSQAIVTENVVFGLELKPCSAAASDWHGSSRMVSSDLPDDLPTSVSVERFCVVNTFESSSSHPTKAYLYREH